MLKYFILIFILPIFISIASAEEDSLSFATYYPAPYGNYKEMRAMRMAIGDNYIKTNDYDWETGATHLINSDTDLIVEGNAGIGTADPKEKLDVNGGIKIGDSDGANPGTIRWKNSQFEGYHPGTGWNTLGGGEVNHATTIWNTFLTLSAPEYTVIGDLSVNITTQGGPVLLLADVITCYNGASATWTYYKLGFARDGELLGISCRGAYSSIGGQRDTSSMYCIDQNPPAGAHTYSLMVKRTAGDSIDFNWYADPSDPVTSRISAVELH